MLKLVLELASVAAIAVGLVLTASAGVALVFVGAVGVIAVERHS